MQHHLAGVCMAKSAWMHIAFLSGLWLIVQLSEYIHSIWVAHADTGCAQAIAAMTGCTGKQVLQLCTAGLPCSCTM